MSARRLERDLAAVVALTGASVLRASPTWSPPPRAGRRVRAQRELSRVARAELALLLRRAARCVLGQDADDDGALRDGLREALELARAEGWRRSRVLERLARDPRAPWPSAARLARCAHALWPCLASRLVLAEAFARDGRERAALAELCHPLVRLPRGAWPRRHVEVLARELGRAHGDPRLARACARLARSLAAERAA